MSEFWANLINADIEIPIPDAALGSDAISCSGGHTVVISGGTIWATGVNSDGRLGLGDYSNRSSFVDTGISATAVAAGSGYTLAIINGEVWVSGTFAGNPAVNEFVNLSVEADYIYSGGSTAFAVKNGVLRVAGSNFVGQLGLGHQDSLVSTFTANGQTSVAKVAGGYRATLIIKENGDVYGSGYNYYHEINSSATTLFTTFTFSISGATDIANSGNNNSYIIKDGTVWSVGANWNGDLGFGDYDPRTEWTDTGFAAESLMANPSDYAMSAMKADGSVYCVGENSDRQLGFSHTNDVLVFTDTGVDGDFLVQSNGSTIVFVQGSSIRWAGPDSYDIVFQMVDGTYDASSFNTSGFTIS